MNRRSFFARLAGTVAAIVAPKPPTTLGRLDFYEVTGETVWPVYGGRSATSAMTEYYKISMDFYLKNPGSMAKLVNIEIPKQVY